MFYESFAYEVVNMAVIHMREREGHCEKLKDFSYRKRFGGEDETEPDAELSTQFIWNALKANMGEIEKNSLSLTHRLVMNVHYAHDRNEWMFLHDVDNATFHVSFPFKWLNLSILTEEREMEWLFCKIENGHIDMCCFAWLGFNW
jgi:hypothetical protein